MTGDIDAPMKSVNAWGQALAAVVLVGALGAGFWGLAKTSAAESEPKPAACSDGATPAAKGKHLSGAQLCEALNRSDLAALLGTPTEIAKTASGSDSSIGKIATPQAQVEFETYTVTLSATYDGLPVAGSEALLGPDARPRKTLGRPGVLYSTRTISISFRLDGGDADSGPGVPARALTVARDSKDRGGSLDVTLWRADGVVPDDAVLLRVAEKVLPTVPGWKSGA
ncbi:hypothetical protein SAMN06272771_1427 [Streptomyces sp. Ag82_O1-12]|uniref:DUF6215 domain-containing protein n=1 Tax=unclassified Streptomyces TaxID=2593676 RepID=UPI000BCC8A88|nr:MULTISPECIES: DUF6215 domain-containing protein [unclassified Streptomyces]SMQ15103.1 hypothetical protein SAMN06272771_1427 [Streptomyces sp. Ag82_O1-12]SOD44131.1 hypothetical protein SAMN06272727_1418 [Streptomyces sp. Ag82_G6-1]